MRAAYVLLGGMVLTQSLRTGEWFGTAMGAGLLSMGIFSLGCAGGKCNYATADKPTKNRNTPVPDNVVYEEIK